MISVLGYGFQPAVKRTPREEAALRVRILKGMHVEDVRVRTRQEMGDRARELGPVDLSMNPLRSYVERRGTAYRTPPAVFGLPEELAVALGDASARTTVTRYGRIGARPMPTRMSAVSAEVLRYRLAANWAGTLIGWSASSSRPFLEALPPEVLAVEYHSDDPQAPTTIRHRRLRRLGRDLAEVEDVYDLTDLDAPVFAIVRGDDDVTEEALGPEAAAAARAYPWRYADGRPFHRIAISGDPRGPYEGIELVEGTLRTCALYTHWGAAVRDAGWPQRNAIGLELEGMDTHSETMQAGISVGPESVLRWRHIDPERPGMLHQFGPGFDPLPLHTAIRSYAEQLVSAMGLPVSAAQTGGEPTETERRALAEAVAATYPDCRAHDGLVLRRVSAVINRETGSTLAETAYPVLYGPEVAEEFEAVAAGDGSADDAAAELEGARSALDEALSSDAPSPELLRAALEAVTEALGMLGSSDEAR